MSQINNAQDIKTWLHENNIDDYRVNKDLTVDVFQNVDISEKNLRQLPIQFGTIHGDFDCSQNKLTSFSGFPKEIKGDFKCWENQIKSLKDCPKLVGGSFNCNHNNITSLEGVQETINGDFNCSNNPISSLQGGPKHINGNLMFARTSIRNEFETFEEGPASIRGYVIGGNGSKSGDICKEDFVRFWEAKSIADDLQKNLIKQQGNTQPKRLKI